MCVRFVFSDPAAVRDTVQQSLTKPPSSFQTRPFSSSSHTLSWTPQSPPLETNRGSPKQESGTGTVPSLKNLDLTLAGFAATKIFDNQHSLPTLTGKSHQLSLDYLYNQKKIVDIRQKEI